MLNSFLEREIALKIETTEGVDASPTAAADALRVLDMTPPERTFERLVRNVDSATFGAKPVTLIRPRGTFSGTVELVGAATVGTAAPCGRLLRVCGHSETLVSDTPGPGSATYKPRSKGTPTGTLYGWHAGERYRFTGVRGMLSEILLEIDNFPRATFELSGNPLAMSEAAVPTDADYSAWQKPPVIVASTAVMTVNGFNVDGVSLALRPAVDMDMIHHTEGNVAKQVGREGECTLRFYRSAFSDLNVHALIDSETHVEVEFAVTTTAGRNVRLLLPNVQLVAAKSVDIKKQLALEVIGIPLKTSGDDEFEIIFE